MTHNPIRDRFIPFRRSDLVEMCVRDGRLASDEVDEFRRLCELIEHIFHLRFHDKLERLKEAYAPFNPDSDTCETVEITADERERRQIALADGLEDLLQAGNYVRIESDEIQKAMKQESLFNIRLQIEFDDFEDVVLFRRGEKINRETIQKYFGLVKSEIDVPTYERVAMYVKFKDEAHFKRLGRRRPKTRPGTTILKLFRNIPVADMEMLFPNSNVRMKTIDKAIIGIPAVAGGVPIFLKAILSLGVIGGLIAYAFGHRRNPPNTAELSALMVATGALGGFIFKQWTNFNTRKMMFMKRLGDNLYFKNLDNNAGVFHYLADSAKEEECKEAILAYFFLYTAKKNIRQSELDRTIEHWCQTKWGATVDFEVADAFSKLHRLGLADRKGDHCTVLPLSDACGHLQRRWTEFLGDSEVSK